MDRFRSSYVLKFHSGFHMQAQIFKTDIKSVNNRYCVLFCQF